MQFTPESSAVFFIAVFALVVLAPTLYVTARFRFSGRISRVSSYMGAIVAVDVIAMLLFIFGASILPEGSDKAYRLALALATGGVAFVIAGDWVFRVRPKVK
jgi:ABC-type maltose transport system permease subunit